LCLQGAALEHDCQMTRVACSFAAVVRVVRCRVSDTPAPDSGTIPVVHEVRVLGSEETATGFHLVSGGAPTLFACRSALGV